MYPEAAILRTVNVGGSFTLEAGETLSIKAELLASRGLMWGGILYPRFAESVSTIGGPAQFEIPTTRQAQWRTLNNEVIDLSDPEAHTHYYTLHIRVETTSGQFVYEKTYHFPLEEGDGSPVDIDQLIEAGIVEGRIISVPDQWSELVAQAVAAAGSADAAEASAGASEAARAGAVAAQDGAESSRDLAAGSASFASGSALLAGQHAQTANDWASAAGSHAAAALTAQTGAQTARTGAETAKTAAETARDLAEASAAIAGIAITPSPDYPGTVLRIAYPAHVSPAPNLIRLPIGV